MFIYVVKKKASTTLETNKNPLYGSAVSCQDKCYGILSVGSVSQSRNRVSKLYQACDKAEFSLLADLQDRKTSQWHCNNTRGVEISACGTGQASPAFLQGCAESHHLIAFNLQKEATHIF